MFLGTQFQGICKTLVGKSVRLSIGFIVGLADTAEWHQHSISTSLDTSQHNIQVSYTLHDMYLLSYIENFVA